MRFLLGGYGDDGGGTALGIGSGSLSAAGELTIGADAVRTAGSPSWITEHPTLDVVYATLEAAGTVAAYARTPDGRLRRVGSPVRVGEAPCHAAVSPGGDALAVSCWVDGALVRIPLNGDGSLGRPSVAPAAIDPHGTARASAPARDDDYAAAVAALRAAVGENTLRDLLPENDAPAGQADPPDVAEVAEERPSRGHEARFLPGRAMVSTDMGLDLLRFWEVFPEGMKLRHSVALPAGSGPRHTLWHPSGHLYVLTELSREIFIVRPDATGSWRLVGGVPIAPGAPDDDTAAEIAVSADGRTVYAGLRGSDTVAALAARDVGDRLEPIALVESGVAWPRHHLVHDDLLLVAGERSNDVVSLPLHPRTGIPQPPRSRAVTPSPTCILPDRPAAAEH